MLQTQTTSTIGTHAGSGAASDPQDEHGRKSRSQPRHRHADLPLGARLQQGNRCSFNLWAPFAKKVEVVLLEGGKRQGASRVIDLHALEDGYHIAMVDDVHPGARYLFRLGENETLPDPASRYQPEGVHGPSEVVSTDFPWDDQGWTGLPLSEYVIYELHAGTVTQQGTFRALIDRLPTLANLGVNVIELMPVAQFPGRRNWGYDGVYPYAVQNSYGGPAGLKHLVNVCHSLGMGVILDVVYNHLGPEGNYLGSYGPYFTDRYKTPWGQALNFDGEHSDAVRRFFIENALQWQSEFHIDALRLDAVHAIRDFSAVPFLQELARATHQAAAQTGKRFYLIAESDLNDPRLVRSEFQGGYGLDAQWSDDFHHILHVLLTGESAGYYQDFGGVEQLAKAYNTGYIFTNDYSGFRKRRHGNFPHLIERSQLIVYSQNHDQIGNRLLGERLSALASFEHLKLAAAAVILSPFTPMLFMGEEYGEPAPFQYMVDHNEPGLLEAVRNGRREEFAAFEWKDEMPDPCAPETFERCVLHPEIARSEPHRSLLRWYGELLSLRRRWALDWTPLRREVEAHAHPESNCVELYHKAGGEIQTLLVLNFSPQNASVRLAYGGNYVQVLDSSDVEWHGTLHGPRHQHVSAHVTLRPWSAQVLDRI